MALLFFQVPDPNPQTDGLVSESLTLRGANPAQDFECLCGLLQLPLRRPVSAGYSEVLAVLGAWQRNHGLMSDGVVGPFMWAMLERMAGATQVRGGWLDRLPPERLCKLFPFTLRKNLQIYVPYVLAALDEAGYGPDASLGAWRLL
jgi:hypothetical protein